MAAAVWLKRAREDGTDKLVWVFERVIETFLSLSVNQHVRSLPVPTLTVTGRD